MAESPIIIDLDALAESMDRSGTDEMLPMLDSVTGSVVYAPDPELTGQDDEELAEEMRDDPDRFLFIPCVLGTEQYRWMAEFSGTVGDDDLRGRIDDALAGKGAFGRFRKVIDDNKDLREKWFAYRRDRLLEEATAWLEEEEVAFSPKLRSIVQPDAPPSPKKTLELRVSHALLLGADGGIVNGKIRRVLQVESLDPRALFKLLVRDLCATHGIAWRNRFIEGKAEFELDGILISQAEGGVNIDVEVASSILNLFNRSSPSLAESPEQSLPNLPPMR